MKERSVLYVGLAGLVVGAASWGQHVQTGDEQRTQPSAAWERVNERKVSLPAGAMLAVRLNDPSQVIKGRRVTASREHSILPSW